MIQSGSARGKKGAKHPTKTPNDEDHQNKEEETESDQHKEAISEEKHSTEHEAGKGKGCLRLLLHFVMGYAKLKERADDKQECTKKIEQHDKHKRIFHEHTRKKKKSARSISQKNA